jgi:diaminopimelate epimerase
LAQIAALLQSNKDMKFTKLHGLGNDYLFVDGFAENVSDPSRIAAKISDRHFGVGADGMILALPSDKADLRMRMFNADGLEGEMCGNGLRCLAKFAYDRGLARKNPMAIETGRGVLRLDLRIRDQKVTEVTANLSTPILDFREIPVNADYISNGQRPNEYRLAPMEGLPEINAVFVSTGNPHAVIFTDNVADLDLATIGPKVEHHPAFPRRANAHWVQVQSPTEIIMRTWERGSGITMACGTGSCASCVAGHLTGRTKRSILAHLPGGDLRVEWRDADNNIYLTGPAVEVFSGEWNG